jgi:uncharacterized repeat protein (TIGR03803 family)
MAMMSKTRPQHSIAPTRRRAAGDGLLLAILLVLSVIAAAPAAAQTFRVLHKFSGAEDGSSPPASVVRDARGNLYGVATGGGAFGYGVVFKLNTTGKERVLHPFSAGDGLSPEAGLVRDSAGNLYGTTLYGGTSEGGKCDYGCGTVFKIDRTGKETVLYAFTGGADGGAPVANLVRDELGNLFGTAVAGGGSTFCHFGCGVVFMLNKAGKETVLYAFTGKADGGEPQGTLIRDQAGNLYGTAVIGGDAICSCGVVFKMTPGPKGQWSYTVLHSFTGNPDGDRPTSLVRGEAGNLYGTTDEGGTFSCPDQPGCGVVFKLDESGKETILYNFTGGADGTGPTSLIRDNAGSLYGAATSGGNQENACFSGCGTLFKLDTGGILMVLHSFSGPDGSYPVGLTMNGAGNFYGTALNGGKPGCGGYGCGVIFKLAP